MKQFFRTPLFRRFVHPAGILLLIGIVIVVGCGESSIADKASGSPENFTAALSTLISTTREVKLTWSAPPDMGYFGGVAATVITYKVYSSSREISDTAGLTPVYTGTDLNCTASFTWGGSYYFVITANNGGADSSLAKTSLDETVLDFSSIIEAEEIARANPTQDRRYHYIAFTLKSADDADKGVYRLGLKKNSEATPTVQNLQDGDVIHRKINSDVKNNVVGYTLNSGIGAFIALDSSKNKIIAHDTANSIDVDQYLLVPGTKYTLYANKVGEDTVGRVKEFSTDADDGQIHLTNGTQHDAGLFGLSYPIAREDKTFMFPDVDINILNQIFEERVTRGTDQLYQTPVDSTAKQESVFTINGVNPKLSILRSSLADAPDKRYMSVGSNYLGVAMLAISAPELIDESLDVGVSQTHTFTYYYTYPYPGPSYRTVSFSTFLDE
ncbi:MAG: hypothetical protein B0D92_06505 [Spirochaeta sp. LUC14_002_19_P3]|nr:MAG: hypothetical protein B0D92_06505 [Spirochaeta sp. LUC14_002_19_P3]